MSQMIRNWIYKDMRWTEIWALLLVWYSLQTENLNTVKFFIKVTKFQVFNFCSNFFLEDFNFAKFIKLRKSQKWSLVKISDYKVFLLSLSIQLFQLKLSDQSFKLTRRDWMVVWVEVVDWFIYWILMIYLFSYVFPFS